MFSQAQCGGGSEGIGESWLSWPGRCHRPSESEARMIVEWTCLDIVDLRPATWGYLRVSLRQAARSYFVAIC